MLFFFFACDVVALFHISLFKHTSPHTAVSQRPLRHTRCTRPSRMKALLLAIAMITLVTSTLLAGNFCSASLARHTERFTSTIKVLAKRKIKYCGSSSRPGAGRLTPCQAPWNDARQSPWDRLRRAQPAAPVVLICNASLSLLAQVDICLQSKWCASAMPVSEYWLKQFSACSSTGAHLHCLSQGTDTNACCLQLEWCSSAVPQ